MDPVTLLRRRTIVLPLACAAALAMLVISESSYWRSVRTLNQLGAMATARGSIQGLQQSILDAETGQRGYLLTHRQEHLRPYDKALQDIDATLGSLERYYAGEPEPAAVLGRLRTLTDAKLAQLALTIRSREGPPAAAVDDIVLSDIGREQMTAIRVLAGELVDHEDRRVAASRGDLFQTLGLGRIGVAALSGLSLLALILYLRQSAALKREQLRLKLAVQAERDRLDVEVRRRTTQLTELTQHLQTAREDERHRLARNLHDELGALLTSAKLDAARIKSRLAGGAPEAQERLAHLVETLNSSIALGRSIIEDLRPSTLDNLGLVATLEILAREFAENTGVEVECNMVPVQLDARAELMVYRLVQEAVTNISKYAQARHVWIELASHDGVVQASVRDDGVGFDTTAAPRSAYGLVGMRFRVEAEGGTLSVVSAPGRGTRLQVTLPQSVLTPPQV
ncbi:MAG: CHASE3 domain-containing protein [Rubrivivax sp.]|nr:CHASE3 domain-containing protein [Rubrivivax sp.]